MRDRLDIDESEIFYYVDRSKRTGYGIGATGFLVHDETYMPARRDSRPFIHTSVRVERVRAGIAEMYMPI